MTSIAFDDAGPVLLERLHQSIEPDTLDAMAAELDQLTTPPTWTRAAGLAECLRHAARHLLAYTDFRGPDLFTPLRSPEDVDGGGGFSGGARPYGRVDAVTRLGGPTNRGLTFLESFYWWTLNHWPIKSFKITKQITYVPLYRPEAGPRALRRVI
jgi:hypothetical protein